MASGKTSVGQALSSLTGFPFLDVDALVETREGMTIAEIFATRGEACFRLLEGELFRHLCQGEGQIIGCGGGTLIDEANRAVLRSRCFAIWLRASAEEIIRRVGKVDAPVRPLVEGEDPQAIVPDLLRDRETIYRGADLALETDHRSVEAIATEICRRLCLPTDPAP